MDHELFELCKEVYERTGWSEENPLKSWYRMGHYFSDGKEYQPGQPFLEEHSGQFPDFPYEHISPLYTSDYLLEKLPQDLNSDNQVYPFTLYRGKYSKQWLAGYEGYFGGQNDPSDTPLKALLNLTIALHEAGELS